MSYFQNKTVWLTGASSGIGEYLAYEFAKNGANLILSSRRKDELDRVKEKCLSINSSINLDIFQLDLAKHEELPEVAKSVLESHPKIDIFINNGGISQRSITNETDISVDKKIMDIDYFGAVILTKSVLPSMLKNGGGHIAAVSSIVGKFGFPLRSAYSAAKHALHGFFESLYAEEAKNNIRVTVIIPGRIRTNISLNAISKDGVFHGKMDEGQDQGMLPDVCARIILKGLQKNKREILVGKKELLMVHIRRFLPGLYYKLAQKVSAT